MTGNSPTSVTTAHKPPRLTDQDPLKLDYLDTYPVDPRAVSRVLPLNNLDQELVRSLTSPNAPVVTLDGDWDTPLETAFEGLDVYRAFHDHVRNGTPWQGTPFFARVMREINGGTVKWSCTSEEQLLQRLEKKVVGLYEDIKKNGYKTQAQLNSKKPADEVRLAIDRYGHFLFIDGRHRLTCATLLNLSHIPCKVVLRHTQWVSFQNEIIEYARATGSNKIYQRIAHPDLANIPAHHVDPRADWMVASLGDYDPAGKRLVDIGAHWGLMCHTLEDAGFSCTAIEKIAEAHSFMDRIRIASDKKFTTWCGDVFDYPDFDGVAVVVALNILHHFLKTEPLHGRLIELLQRLQPDIMFFQPHAADPPGQMNNAFRNYCEQEFVEFVGKHTGLQHSMHLGTASDGRPVFKLWRPC